MRRILRDIYEGLPGILEALSSTLLILWCLWALTSCGVTAPVPTPVPAPAPAPAPGPGLAGLGEWAIWAGGAGLLLASVLGVLAPPGLRGRVATLAMGAGALIAGGWLLGFIERWLAVLMIGGLILCVAAAAAWLWGHRRRIAMRAEDWTGLDLAPDYERPDLSHG